MPYSKKRRYSYNKRKYPSRRQVVNAKKYSSVRTYIPRYVSSKEVKMFRTNSTNWTQSTGYIINSTNDMISTTLHPMYNLICGTAEDNRIGNKISVLRVELDVFYGTIDGPPASGTYNQYLWKDEVVRCYGVSPCIGNVSAWDTQASSYWVVDSRDPHLYKTYVYRRGLFPRPQPISTSSSTLYQQSTLILHHFKWSKAYQRGGLQVRFGSSIANYPYGNAIEYRCSLCSGPQWYASNQITHMWILWNSVVYFTDA